MIFVPTSLKGSFVIEAKPFVDERGSFARFFCKKEFSQIGHDEEWVQLNHSSTQKKATIRGMHFQRQPFREIKMVKCISGSVYDVIVDLRQGSTTFLKWFGIELSSVNNKMIYIPEGFAHGFQCLEDNCQLIYLHSQFYTPDFEAGIRYNDPVINIEWPIATAMLSSRDLSHPLLDNNFKGI